MSLRFWKVKPLSVEDRLISDSIKVLKTLTVRDGRVSINASEILDQPGYLEARRRAAQLVRNYKAGASNSPYGLKWSAMDVVGIEELAAVIARSLQRSRQAGITYARAIEALKYMPLQGLPHG